jgi:predicted nucleic acid-binding protein
VTLIDTSVWVNHFRMPDERVLSLTASDEVGTHPFVIGELAAGNLKNREKTLRALRWLDQPSLPADDEVHDILESQRLWGKGLGWIDLHILAATKLAGWSLYTADVAMAAAARQIGIPCQQPPRLI